jgi:hypothetical protein
MVCGLAASAQTAALADAQGWSGPGWYITNTATPTHAYVLFEGPHTLQSGCVEAYDRLYSPIGICRFLDTKPQELAR